MRHKGTVAFFRGTWGFIAPASGGEKIFVHQESILSEGFRELFAGEAVEYEEAVCQRGPKAVRVALIQAAVEGGASCDKRQ